MLLIFTIGTDYRYCIFFLGGGLSRRCSVSLFVLGSVDVFFRALCLHGRHSLPRNLPRAVAVASPRRGNAAALRCEPAPTAARSKPEAYCWSRIFGAGYPVAFAK